MAHERHICHLEGSPAPATAFDDRALNYAHARGALITGIVFATCLIWLVSCSRIPIVSPGSPGATPTPTPPVVAVTPSSFGQDPNLVTATASPVTLDPAILLLQRKKLELENNKLLQETTKIAEDTKKLQEELSWTRLFWSNLAAFAALSAVAWAIGQFVTSRRDDARKRFDQMLEGRFTAAVEQLGGKERGAQLGAAALLRFFLRRDERFNDFHGPVFDIAAANLRLQPKPWSRPVVPDPLIRELGHVLRLACPLARQHKRATRGDTLLDATDVKLQHAHLVNADLTGISMSYAHLPGADLMGARLVDAILIHTNLSGAELSKARLCRANLTNVMALRGDRLAGSSEARFANACLWNADLSEAKLSSATFTQAILASAILVSADLDDGKFRGANLRGADLQRANLTVADFTNADLTGANLSKAILTGANFSGANLTMANLTEANLIGSTIDQACKLRGARLINVTDLIDPAILAICLKKGATLT